MKKASACLQRKILQEFHKPKNPHTRKGYGTENIEMTVIADDVFGIRNDGTVHKLVVIRVLLDQTETELRIVASTERAF